MSRSAPPSDRSSTETRIEQAQSLAARGKLDEARGAYRELVERDPEDVEALRGLARVLQRVHDVPAAIAAFRSVLALAPDDWEAQNDLGAALMERGAWDEAQLAFETARAAAPDEPMLAVNLATLAVRRGRAADAAVVLSECLAQHRNYAPALAGLGFALRELGRHGEASAALERALSLVPHDATAACGLSRVLLEAGRASEASVVARAYLRVRPGHAGALAAEALARLALGDATTVEQLFDYERLIAEGELSAPEGYDDLAAFNRDLAAHVVSHPTLVRAPVSHATKDGLHSGSLLVSPRGPVAAFESALRSAVNAYLRALPRLPEHPFATSRPRAAIFNVWGVVLERGGHQTPHIHPAAWLSGVYYPQVPAAVGDGDSLAGFLEFGGVDRPFPTRLAQRKLCIRPREGLLVLFPSYFYHRTVPFDGAGTRVSVAFDLVPVG